MPQHFAEQGWLPELWPEENCIMSSPPLSTALTTSPSSSNDGALSSVVVITTVSPNPAQSRQHL